MALNMVLYPSKKKTTQKAKPKTHLLFKMATFRTRNRYKKPYPLPKLLQTALTGFKYAYKSNSIESYSNPLAKGTLPTQNNDYRVRNRYPKKALQINVQTHIS